MRVRLLAALSVGLRRPVRRPLARVAAMGGTTRERGSRIRGILVIAGWLRRAGLGKTRGARRRATRIGAALLRGSLGGEAVRRTLLPVVGTGLARARVPVRERLLRVLPVGELSGRVLPLGVLAGSRM